MNERPAPQDRSELSHLVRAVPHALKKRKEKGGKMALFIRKRKMDGRGFGKSDNGRSDKKRVKRSVNWITDRQAEKNALWPRRD